MVSLRDQYGDQYWELSSLMQVHDGTKCILSKLVDDNNLRGSSQYGGGQGCYSEGPGQTGDMAWWEPTEVQQREMQSLTSGM